MALTRVSYNFPTPTAGTGPFVTAHWFESDDDPTIPDLFELASLCRTHFNDDLDAAINAAAGSGYVLATCDTGTVVLESNVSGLTPAGGGQYRNPGFAFRVVMESARPPGGRANAMYWPMPDTTYYGNTGATAGGIETIFYDWANGLNADLGDTVFTWVSRHYVDNDDHAMVTFPVVTVSTANTVSFLRLRYR
jgi:hypothetical protein